MEEEEGGIRLSKRFSDQGGEVDYKTSSGTAWSHSFLNQKPWHPLSYPNQRRKWIAEQQHAQHQRRNEEVAREYAQEQNFFRQSALVSKKEKEKLEMMQAVSFMYVRPPGYNAESAKAAEIAEAEKKTEQKNPSEGTASSMPQESAPMKEEKKAARPKDVFGRTLPTAEEFEVLKNAPKMDTGVHGRVKPFAVEIRNVKCVRCGTFGHQSGDRECPLKDAIMPNEENRLKRDDPLTAILAHTDAAEPLKWELKQKPGLSPPRGGFDPDDPNQQIVAEDIYDEYGGFLGGGDIPELLASLPFLKNKKKSKRKGKHKKQSSSSSSDDNVDGKRSGRKEITHKRKKKDKPPSSPSEDSVSEKHKKKSKKKYYSSDDQDLAHHQRRPSSGHRNKTHRPSEELKSEKQNKGRDLKNSYSSSDEASDHDRHKSSTSRHRNATRHRDRSPLLHNDDRRSSRRKGKRSSYSTADEDSDHDSKKHSTSRRSNARNQVDRSASPYDGGHRSSRRKENKYYSSDDGDSDHGHKKHSSSRHRDIDKSRSFFDAGERNSRRKETKKSHSSEEQDSDHDNRKHRTSRHRNARQVVDRSPSPYNDGGRSSRKENIHNKRKKPKNGNSELDSSESSEYDKHDDRRYHKQSYSPDFGGSRQHMSEHRHQHRHHR